MMIFGKHHAITHSTTCTACNGTGTRESTDLDLSKYWALTYAGESVDPEAKDEKGQYEALAFYDKEAFTLSDAKAAYRNSLDGSHARREAASTRASRRPRQRVGGPRSLPLDAVEQVDVQPSPREPLGPRLNADGSTDRRRIRKEVE